MANPPGLLLVEGESDEHVVDHLRRRVQTISAFEIRRAGNVSGLLNAIEPEVLADGRRALGILVDADDCPASRWAELRDRLEAVAIETPASPEPGGVIVPPTNGPRVGVWMMPDNRSPGELEDFVRTMIPECDPVWPRARDYVDGIPREHRRFRPGKALRAQVYAWLATREVPGRMGAAIGAGDLDVGTPSGLEFANWLRLLFGTVPASP